MGLIAIDSQVYDDFLPRNLLLTGYECKPVKIEQKNNCGGPYLAGSAPSGPAVSVVVSSSEDPMDSASPPPFEPNLSLVLSLLLLLPPTSL